MINITSASLFFLAAGIFTSVSILSAYQILFTIPLIYFTYKAVINKNFKELPTSAWCLLAFAIWGCITLFLNYNILDDAGKSFGRLQYFLYGSLGVFVFQQWMQKASDKAKAFILNTFFLSIVLGGCMAIYKVVTVGGRTGGFIHIMRYGYGLAFVITVLLSALLHKEKLPKWINIKFTFITLLFSFLGLGLSQTRGAALGLVCALPFVLFFYKPKLGKIIALLTGFGMLILGGIYLFGNQKNETENRYLMSKNNSSDNIRMNLWMCGIYSTLEKPITGWGFSNGHTQCKRISDREGYEMDNMETSHAHNVFLDISRGTGITGLLIFLAWLFFWVKESLKSKDIVKFTVIPFAISFLVSSQFETTVNANIALLVFAFYTATKTIHAKN